MISRSGSVFCLAVMALVSCSRVQDSGRGTVAFVSKVLADRNSEEAGIIAHAAEPSRSGDIYLIGSPYFCTVFGDRFSACDERDNVDGSSVPDMLPDFAGETLVSIMDETGLPADADSLALVARRERSVRLALTALDTASHLSPYDMDGLIYKAPAKIIILGDPLIEEYGHFDIDTLFRSTSCNVPLVAPVDLMLEKVFSSRPGRRLNVGMIVDAERTDTLVYGSLFRKCAERHGAGASECVILPSSAGDNLLHILLDRYSVGHKAPLDALIIDDIALDVRLVKSELADMLSILNEGSMTYGRMIADDFSILDSFYEVSGICYDILRGKNLFTHNISKPQFVSYLPVDKPGAEDGQIMLIPVSYVQN